MRGRMRSVCSKSLATKAWTKHVVFRHVVYFTHMNYNFAVNLLMFCFSKLQYLRPLMRKSRPDVSFLVANPPTDTYQLPLAVKTGWPVGVEEPKDNFNYKENILVCNLNCSTHIDKLSFERCVAS